MSVDKEELPNPRRRVGDQQQKNVFADESSPIHILLVEDSIADATLLRRSIRDSSWSARAEVDECTTLAKAAEMVAAREYDVVMLDMGLPDGRGISNIETLLEIRRDLTIVVLTGNDDASAALDALNLGAQEYAIKGMYEGEALVRIMRHAIERNRMAVELRELREREWFLATHDNLTKLPNRQLFNDRVEQALATAKRQKGQFAICFLDLDGFKPVNDEFGHAVGDELLTRVATVLQEVVRDTDTVARIGGDEFVLLLTPLSNWEQATNVSNRVIEQLTTIRDVNDHEVNIGASIGISIFPDHGANLDQLMRNSDMAMYCSKRAGRGKVSMYDDSMRTQPKTP